MCFILVDKRQRTMGQETKDNKALILKGAEFGVNGQLFSVM